jgi:hypothetical protein
VIPDYRKRFNRTWSQEAYSKFLERLVARSGATVGFRCSETPVFLPPDLLQKMVRYGKELYSQLASNTNYREASEEAIPAEFRVPNEVEHPLFVQADFGLVREADGALEPKLVEIQGFPSIYGLQPLMAKIYDEVYGLSEHYDRRLTPFLGGHNESSYIELLRRAVLAGHDPREVILLEIEPFQQKTLPDFLMHREMLDIGIACITELEKRGRRLYVRGSEIKRIYNRVIVDELVRKNIYIGFRLTDDLDVEWAGHPNWFFRLSKFSLPWFRHVCVPETRFLSDVQEVPANLSEYVLKPLYSFAGLGVKIAPSREEIDAIPDERRREFILQRRMEFVPTIETPSGPTKLETRIMYVWDGHLVPVMTVLRTGRGKMMGVDFNKDLDWVGASAGFHIPE